MVQTPKRYKPNGNEDSYKVDMNSSSRKCNKPLMERRRRARINDSLNQLKSLVLQANGKEESNFSKLDKADILEMTVKHIAAIQHNGILGSPSSLSNSNNFAGGFSACAKETLGLLSTLSDVTGTSAALQAGLFNHLVHAPCSPNTGTVSPERHSLPSYSQQQQQRPHQQQNHVMNSPYNRRIANAHHVATLREDRRATYPASQVESNPNLRMPALQKLSNNTDTGLPVSCGAARSCGYTVSVTNHQALESRSRSSIFQPTTSATYSQGGISSPVQIKQEPDTARDYDENLRDFSDSASEGSRSPSSEDTSPTNSKTAWRPW